MNPDRSVTGWIATLKDGDFEAANQIWKRYFDRVCQLAKAKLPAESRRAADEEDVAVSALHALCDGVAQQRFRRLEDRHDLWQVLAMLTSRKAVDAIRRESRRPELGESAIAARDSSMRMGIEHICSGQPDDRWMSLLSATCSDLLERLDPKLRAVTLLKLEGHTNAEIARMQQKSERTIERYCRLIRCTWLESEQ